MADSAAISLAAMSLDDECNACAKPTPLPVLICFKCSEGKSPEGESTYTKYCSIRCRTAHQGQHAQHCKNQNIRRAIYRAGELLQSALYQMRLLAFDLKIDSVEKKDDVLYFKDGEYKGGKEFPFYAFPGDVVKDPGDAKALLSYSFCNDAPVFLNFLAEKALKGLARSIEQAELQISAQCKVRRIYPNGNVAPDIDMHSVMGIDGCDGESYIIDITGAQYGQFKAVMPLGSYVEQNNARVRTMYYAGGSRVSVVKDIKMKLEDPSSDPRCQIGLFKVATALNTTLEEWEARWQTSIGQLLLTDKTVFAKGKEELLYELGNAVDSALEEIFEVTDMKTALGWLLEPAGQEVQDPGAATDEEGRMTCIVSNKVEGSRLYKMWVAQGRADLQVSRPEEWKTTHEPNLAAGGTIRLALPSQWQGPA
ncbi:uncharacterized protein MYCFIDRAFT_197348 [Pseudocercospora fijiensis CIRAD86]|uniref:MYND-type zinc finger protein samB n=1 Tax=Pseudocercospora fijiensis (strain CIRAD86) TaxID=383855 RepID=M3AC58_PSEFD|nr:uncharacterized protein MYCFIDRAFT_197348 [Pseudocercospora fijiensis CIRAD86]EME82146.1 hypothetical protein MYCFIDRAFT_197348 [Pseudocercospora fijiensis CIRAD86]